MAISKIKVGTTEHELQTTIANVTNLQASLDAKANSADIAKTASYGITNTAVAYMKISDFGAWGTGVWYNKGFSMLITSRAGELVWVSLAANDSATTAKAFRLIDTYAKINNLYYSASESALYCRMAAYCNNLCAHILTNINGDYVPTIAQASALPDDAVEINIVEFGVSSNGTQVGDTSVNLLLGGAATRPTYNGNDVALKSDVDAVTLDTLGGNDRYYTETEVDAKVSTLNTAISGKAASSHTHSAATTSAAGFMSASDKAKLDGITASADSVSVSSSLSSGTQIGTITVNGTATKLYAPTAGQSVSYGAATTSSLGLVKSGTDITVDGSGNVSVNDDSHNHIISNIDNLQGSLDDKASVSVANTYNGEQKFQHAQYCPTAQDSAFGVGAAYKASRGVVNQEIVGQIIMPHTAVSDDYGCDNAVNTIKFQQIADINDGVPTFSTVATLTPDYLQVPALHWVDSIDGEPDNYTNHKIVLGKANRDKVEIYEFGGTLNLYRSCNGVNDLIMSVTPDSFTYRGSPIALKSDVEANKPKVTTITLSASAWTGSSNPWSQSISVNGATANSKLDLQLTATQVVALQDLGIAFMLQNDSGTVTAWAIGGKPTSDYTMQVLITEVQEV